MVIAVSQQIRQFLPNGSRLAVRDHSVDAEVCTLRVQLFGISPCFDLGWKHFSQKIDNDVPVLLEPQISYPGAFPAAGVVHDHNCLL
jgi:hypothetical protein